MGSFSLSERRRRFKVKEQKFTEQRGLCFYCNNPMDLRNQLLSSSFCVLDTTNMVACCKPCLENRLNSIQKLINKKYLKIPSI